MPALGHTLVKTKQEKKKSVKIFGQVFKLNFFFLFCRIIIFLLSLSEIYSEVYAAKIRFL